MTVGRSLRRLALGGALVLGLGASGWVCQRVGARGRYATEFSSYGGGPEGTRGLFLLAEELGARPARWAEDLGRLPAEGGLLVALGSCQQSMRRPVGRIEGLRLREWVEGGGVVLIAGLPDYLEGDELGVELVADPEACEPSEGLIGLLAAERRRRRDGASGPSSDDDGLAELRRLAGEDPAAAYEVATATDGLAEPQTAFGMGPATGGLDGVGLRSPLRLEVAERVEAEHLLSAAEDGRPLAVRVPIGAGAFILVASASAFQNRDLRSQRGGVFFARLLREVAPTGPVLFDEYHLGVGERRGLVRYLRQIGAAPILWQLLLLIALGGWRIMTRFGRPRRALPPAPLGTTSHVEGVGALYRASRDRAGAGRVLVRRGLASIASHHHLDSMDSGALASALDKRGRSAASEVVRELERATCGRGGLARFATEVDELVERAKGE